MVSIAKGLGQELGTQYSKIAQYVYGTTQFSVSRDCDGQNLWKYVSVHGDEFASCLTFVSIDQSVTQNKVMESS